MTYSTMKAATVETLLRAWSFPELNRVTDDTSAEDIVISGKARKDNGKGYRAITYRDRKA